MTLNLVSAWFSDLGLFNASPCQNSSGNQCMKLKTDRLPVISCRWAKLLYWDIPIEHWLTASVIWLQISVNSAILLYEMVIGALVYSLRMVWEMFHSLNNDQVLDYPSLNSSSDTCSWLSRWVYISGSWSCGIHFWKHYSKSSVGWGTRQTFLPAGSLECYR